MLYYVLATGYAFICLMLLLVVLLQQGRGGDIANAFGGGGSQTAFGARQGATVLSRATTVLGALFMLGSLGLAAYGQRGPSSVISGTQAPVRRPAPASAPAQPGNQPPATPQSQAPSGATTQPGTAPTTAPAQTPPPAPGSKTPPEQPK